MDTRPPPRDLNAPAPRGRSYSAFKGGGLACRRVTRVLLRNGTETPPRIPLGKLSQLREGEIPRRIPRAIGNVNQPRFLGHFPFAFSPMSVSRPSNASIIGDGAVDDAN